MTVSIPHPLVTPVLEPLSLSRLSQERRASLLRRIRALAGWVSAQGLGERWELDHLAAEGEIDSWLGKGLYRSRGDGL